MMNRKPDEKYTLFFFYSAHIHTHIVKPLHCQTAFDLHYHIGYRTHRHLRIRPNLLKCTTSQYDFHLRKIKISSSLIPTFYCWMLLFCNFWLTNQKPNCNCKDLRNHSKTFLGITGMSCIHHIFTVTQLDDEMCCNPLIVQTQDMSTTHKPI